MDEIRRPCNIFAEGSISTWRCHELYIRTQVVLTSSTVFTPSTGNTWLYCDHLANSDVINVFTYFNNLPRAFMPEN